MGDRAGADRDDDGDEESVQTASGAAEPQSSMASTAAPPSMLSSSASDSFLGSEFGGSGSGSLHIGRLDSVGVGGGGLSGLDDAFGSAGSSLSIGHLGVGGLSGLGGLGGMGGLGAMGLGQTDMFGNTITLPNAAEVSGGGMMIDSVPPPKGGKSKGPRKSAAPPKKADFPSAAAAASSVTASVSPLPSLPSSTATFTPSRPHQHAKLTLAPFQLGTHSAPAFHRLSGNANAANSVLTTASNDDLRQVALEAARMAREAHARAARLETELRKLYDAGNGRTATGGGGPSESLDRQPWYQSGTRLLLSLSPVPDEPSLANEMNALVTAVINSESHKRKRGEAGLDGEWRGGGKAASAASGGKKKSKSSASASSFSTTVTGKRGSALQASQALSAQNEWAFLDDLEDLDAYADEGYDSDEGGGGGGGGGNRGRKKKMTEKEKARQISQFWSEEIEPYFDFPTPAQLELIRPRDSNDFYTNYHGAGSSSSFGPRNQHQSDPSFRIPPRGEYYRDVWERAAAAEAEAREKAIKERQAGMLAHWNNSAAGGGAGGSNSTAASAAAATSAAQEEESKEKEKRKRNSKTKSLAASLSSLGIDDARLRKSLLDTDKLLGGDKTFHVANAQSLSQRLLSMLVEVPPGAPRVGPWIPHPSGKDAHPPVAAPSAHKKRASEYPLEKRIEMELKYVGLFNTAGAGSSSSVNTDYNYTREILDRSDDELSAQLRALQKELSACLEQQNATKQMLFPIASRLVDHPARLAQLAEAESQLIRVYQTKVLGAATSAPVTGKKTLSSLSSQFPQMLGSAAVDHACEKAVQQWEATLRAVGTRRQLTGFIPDPVDIGGIPRAKLPLYQPARSYADVITRGVEVDSVPALPELDGVPIASAATPVGSASSSPPVLVTGPPWKHFIHPQHPHNPNYQAPPPPPPPPAQPPAHSVEPPRPSHSSIVAPSYRSSSPAAAQHELQGHTTFGSYSQSPPAVSASHTNNGQQLSSNGRPSVQQFTQPAKSHSGYAPSSGAGYPNVPVHAGGSAPGPRYTPTTVAPPQHTQHAQQQQQPYSGAANPRHAQQQTGQQAASSGYASNGYNHVTQQQQQPHGSGYRSAPGQPPPSSQPQYSGSGSRAGYVGGSNSGVGGSSAYSNHNPYAAVGLSGPSGGSASSSRHAPSTVLPPSQHQRQGVSSGSSSSGLIGSLPMGLGMHDDPLSSNSFGIGQLPALTGIGDDMFGFQ